MLSKKKRTSFMAISALVAIGVLAFAGTANAATHSTTQSTAHSKVHIGTAAFAHGGAAPAAGIGRYISHETVPSPSKVIGIVKATGSWITTSFRTLTHHVSVAHLLPTWRLANHHVFIGKIAGRPHMRDLHVIGILKRRVPLTGRINKRVASYIFRLSLHHGYVPGSFRIVAQSYPPFD